MICGWGGSRKLAKVAGAERSGHMRDEKLYAVARSTCPSQDVQNTSASGPLLEVRMLKKLRTAARSQFPSQIDNLT